MTKEEKTKELERLRALLSASQGVGYQDRRDAIQARIDTLQGEDEAKEEPKETTPPLDLSQS